LTLGSNPIFDLNRSADAISLAHHYSFAEPPGESEKSDITSQYAIDVSKTNKFNVLAKNYYFSALYWGSLGRTRADGRFWGSPTDP